MDDLERLHWRRWAREVEENDSNAAHHCWRAGQAVLQIDARTEREALLPADTLHHIAQARASMARNTYSASDLTGHNPQKAFRFKPEAVLLELSVLAG